MQPQADSSHRLAVHRLRNRGTHHQPWDSAEEGHAHRRDALAEVKGLSNAAIALVLGHLATGGAGPARLPMAADKTQVAAMGGWGASLGSPPTAMLITGSSAILRGVHRQVPPPFTCLSRDGLERWFHRANETASDTPRALPDMVPWSDGTGTSLSGVRALTDWCGQDCSRGRGKTRFAPLCHDNSVGHEAVLRRLVPTSESTLALPSVVRQGSTLALVYEGGA
jgi:hypothetical protein